MVDISLLNIYQTLESVIEATGGKYTIESIIGQFMFENTSLFIDSDLISFSFQLH